MDSFSMQKKGVIINKFPTFIWKTINIKICTDTNTKSDWDTITDLKIPLKETSICLSLQALVVAKLRGTVFIFIVFVIIIENPYK